MTITHSEAVVTCNIVTLNKLGCGKAGYKAGYI